MLINNIASPARIVFLSVNKMGISVAASATGVEISDEYGDHAALVAAIAAGDIEVAGYAADNAISSAEVETMVRGLYKVALDGTPGAVALPMVAATITSVNDENFDLRVDYRLTLLVDDVFDIVVDLTKGVYTALTLVDALNADTGFTEHLVASASTTKVVLTARSSGLNSKIQVATSEYNDANSLIGFSGTEVAGTGSASEVKLLVTSSTGLPFAKGKVVVGVYDAATVGALTGTAVIQIVKTGTWDGTIYADEATLYSSSDGIIEFEVHDASGPIYIEVALPSTHFLAATLAARVTVAVA